MSDTTRLVLLGFGTVGQGLARLIVDQGQRPDGRDLRVVGIADLAKGNVYDPTGIDLEASLRAAEHGEPLAGAATAFAGDGVALLAQADADVMVELTFTDIETAEPATSHIRTALENGMHVVTSNKGPLALHFRELTTLAHEKGVRLLYEGTVMSGTPVFCLIRECLAHSGIREVRGILNGTSNYILTEMAAGRSYEAALTRAQELGYAEAVPDADVLGLDALAKIAILASSVFDIDATPKDFSCEGITDVTPAAIDEAAAEGRRIKLVGRVWRDSSDIRGEVRPVAVDSSDFLYGITGVGNALTIQTEALGEVSIVGPGAGRAETGYAAFADILRATRT